MSSSIEKGPDPRAVFRAAERLASIKGERRGYWDDKYFVGISENPEGGKSKVSIHYSMSSSGDYVSIDGPGYHFSVSQNSFERDPKNEFRISSDSAVPADILDILAKVKPDDAAHAQFREDREGSAMARAIAARTESKVFPPRTVLSKFFPFWSEKGR